jgi:hypothetical protein
MTVRRSRLILHVAGPIVQVTIRALYELQPCPPSIRTLQMELSGLGGYTSDIV